MKYLTEEKMIKYKLVALHPKSKKTMWIFVESKNLKSALSTWKLTNPN
jgi:hypothetical protein